MPNLPGQDVTDNPNKPPLVDPNAPKPDVPASWVPDERTVVQFVNYLWSAGLLEQAALFWVLYCRVVGKKP